MSTEQLQLFSGFLAYTSAGVTLLGMLFIFIFLRAGEPFGRLNDLSIALQALTLIPVGYALHATAPIGIFGAVALASGSVLLVAKGIDLALYGRSTATKHKLL